MTSGDARPTVIIHGGAGHSLRNKGGLEAVRASLHTVVSAVYARLLEGESAQSAVVLGCQMMEDDPRFNAGTGAVLQSDGQIRLSASLMNGLLQRFSGVINVSRVKNPIELAHFLQGESDRVLSDYGALELLRELQIPPYSPLTELRLQEWVLEHRGDFSHEMAGVVAEKELITEAGRGTIGVVVRDRQGQLVAGTSTGGKGFERIGRVSDSATPAGNYATADAAVSCTGVGEDILDECLAARIVVRVTDGAPLQEAFRRSFTEADQRQREFGAIGLDATGAIAWGKTSQVLLAAYHNGETLGDTLDLETNTQVGGIASP